MKKTLSYVLIILLLFVTMFVLTACDKNEPENNNGGSSVDTSGLTAEEYETLTEDELIAKVIKDPANTTADEYVALIQTLRFAKTNDKLEIEKSAENVTMKALKKIKDDENMSKPTLTADNLKTLLNDEAYQVRGYGVEQMSGGLFGTSDSNRTLVKDIMAKEENPYVQKKIVSAFSNDAKKDEEIGKYFVKLADSDNARVRYQVALALGNSWSKGVDGAVDTIIKLMSDSDKDVKKAALKYSGKLADEKVIDPIVSILNDPEQYDYHGEAVQGLTTLWFDYPFHENTSEKAYKATMDYLKKEPTENIPAWTAYTGFNTKNDSKFDEYLSKATYFNAEEIVDTLMKTALNENASFLARTTAAKTAGVYATKAKYQSYEAQINALTDKNASNVQNTYKTALDKITE